MFFPRTAPVHGVYHHCLSPLHSVQYHMFADDTQSYSYCQISETRLGLIVARLSSCVDYLAKSYASLRLQTQPIKDRVYLVWLDTHQSAKNTIQLPITPGLWLSSRLLRSRSLFLYVQGVAHTFFTMAIRIYTFFQRPKIKPCIRLRQQRSLDATGYIDSVQSHGLLLL